MTFGQIATRVLFILVAIVLLGCIYLVVTSAIQQKNQGHSMPTPTVYFGG